MELREFFSEEVVDLDLKSTTKDEVLKELIALLALDEKSEGILYKMLKGARIWVRRGSARGSPSPTAALWW